MIALQRIPTRTEVTADQIAKHLASLGCTERQIQRHLMHGIPEKVEPKVTTPASWPIVHWVKPWEARFD
jgi:hypothetical protein